MSMEKTEGKDCISDDSARSSLTRAELYELVWSEPMLKVGARYGVSSSYMARVCTRLNVPRPARGYWAKLEVGKAPKRPPLPEPRPGDELVWRRGDGIDVHRPLPKPPTHIAKRRPTAVSLSTSEHSLIKGARTLFEIGRVVGDAEYLKPNKRLLVDITATKATLAKALSFANLLFSSLEDRGHRVVISAASEYFHRHAIDEREQPSRARNWNDLWTPGRPTVVYIGTVAIGLTILETSEEVKVRNVGGGKYIRESEYVPPKRHGNAIDFTWTTTKDFATGRLLLQAYSPYHIANWACQWKETTVRDLVTQIPAIVKELEGKVSEIARLVEEGEQRAVIERERWEAEQARWRKEEAERRAAKALAESKQELLQIINEWTQWQNIERFFSAIEQQFPELDPETKEAVRRRLDEARGVLEAGSAIENLKKWKLPGER